MNSYFRRRPCGCDTFRPWRSKVPRNSTPFSTCPSSRGLGHGGTEHVLLTNKKTGSLTLNETSRNTPDDFFLRPFLTREEFSYWSSHFGGLSSSYACSSASSCAGSCACASNPKDNTTVMYQHMKPFVCARSVTAQPCTKPLFGDWPVPRTKSTSVGLYGNTGLVTKPSVPGEVESTFSRGRLEANPLGCCYSMTTSSNIKRPSGCTLKEKGIIDSPSPEERSILPTQENENSRLKRFSNNGDLTKTCGAHQALSPELRRRLSERYLCGDKSFEENSATPTRHEGERPRVCDDVEGTIKAQAPNETIDLNDTLASFLNGPLSRSIFHGKNPRFKIDESRGMRRSRGIKRSRGAAKRRVQSRPAKSTTITSDVGCEISAKKANYERRVETRNTTHSKTQPKIVGTFSLADIKAKSGDVDRDRDESKQIGDVINAEKPVQRGLLKNTKSSLYGSYALDYESMPKLISVLSAPMAKVVSDLKT